MKRIFFGFFLFFLLASSIFADVTIEKKHRVENILDGYCAWCSIEMLANQHKIKKLYNLAKRRSEESDFKEFDKKTKKWKKLPYVWVDYGNNKEKEHRGYGGEQAISNKLKSLGVKFRYQRNGNDSMKVVNYAMKNDLGCVVVVHWTFFTAKEEDYSYTHAIVLVGIDSKQVRFVDSNDISHVYKAGRNWFNKNWTGYVLVLEKPNENSKSP